MPQIALAMKTLEMRKPESQCLIQVMTVRENLEVSYLPYS